MLPYWRNSSAVWVFHERLNHGSEKFSRARRPGYVEGDWSAGRFHGQLKPQELAALSLRINHRHDRSQRLIVEAARQPGAWYLRLTANQSCSLNGVPGSTPSWPRTLDSRADVRLSAVSIG